MAEHTQEKREHDSTTIGVFRSSATVKGGKRFSFGALVVVGDKRGQVGLGYAKANEVPPAVEKATKDAKKQFKRCTLQGGTIPHEVTGRYSASIVKLCPASPGTGVVAGTTVRAVLEQAGITDCLSKAYGSTNKKNLAKATLAALQLLRRKEALESLRGVQLGSSEVDGRLERGKAFAPAARAGETMRGPQNTIGQDRRGGGGGRGGRGGGGGGGGRGGRGGRSQQGPGPDAAPSSDAPSA